MYDDTLPQNESKIFQLILIGKLNLAKRLDGYLRVKSYIGTHVEFIHNHVNMYRSYASRKIKINTVDELLNNIGKIQYIKIIRCKFDDIPNWIFNMCNLIKIVLDDVYIPHNISFNRNIKRLHILNSNISSFDWINNINVDHMRIEMCQHPQTIDVCNHNIKTIALSGLGFSHVNLNGIPNLRNIQLTKTNVNLLNINNIHNLDFLWYSDNSDASIIHINNVETTLDILTTIKNLKNIYVDQSTYKNIGSIRHRHMSLIESKYTNGDVLSII